MCFSIPRDTTEAQAYVGRMAQTSIVGTLGPRGKGLKNTKDQVMGR